MNFTFLKKMFRRPNYFDKQVPEFRKKDSWDTMRNMIHRLELLEEKVHALNHAVPRHADLIKSLTQATSEIDHRVVDMDREFTVLENSLERLRGRDQPQVIDTVKKRKRKKS